MGAGSLAGPALDAVVRARDHGFPLNYVEHIRRADLGTGSCTLAFCFVDDWGHAHTSFFCFSKVLKYPAIRLRRDLLFRFTSSLSTRQFFLKSVENLSG